VREDDIFDLGAQLAYYILLSLFPFLLFLLSVLSFAAVPVEEFNRNIVQFLPEDVGKILNSVVGEIFSAKQPALLSIGALITVWSASRGISAVGKGLNKAFDAEETRPYWKVNALAVVFTIGMAAVILLSILFLIFGEVIGRTLLGLLDRGLAFSLLWGGLRYAAAAILLVFGFSLLYKWLPDRRVRFTEALPGAVFTTLGNMGTSSLFSFYVGNFTNYTRIYGSIGGAIVLLLWIYLNSVILLLGGELNATIADYRAGLPVEKYELPRFRFPFRRKPAKKRG
jgi:membrane protein